MAPVKSLLTTAEITDRYLSGERMASIARTAGVTEHSVWKRLSLAGVPRTRLAAPGQVACAHCRATFVRHRHHARRALRQFCSRECYVAWIQAKATFTRSNYGTRSARSIVAALVPLRPEHVVHHVNGNQSDNRIENLAVFASQSEHMSHHRGGNGRPIWSGQAEDDAC